MAKKDIGTFKVTSKVRVSDPCYDRDTWCTDLVDLPKGEYIVSVDTADTGMFKGKVKTLTMQLLRDEVHAEALRLSQIGVDSGACGFFNDKTFEQAQKQYEQLDYTRKPTILANNLGVVTGSGLGDGVYMLTELLNSTGHRIGLTLTFLDDEGFALY